MIYLRKPLDVERWGKLETWEGMDAAYIIGGTEPEYGQSATLTNKATEVHRAMLSSVAAGILRPMRVTESGATYFLAAELVKWAKEKDFALVDGLEAAVHATTLAYLARHKAAKETQMRESVFNLELRTVWKSKDLWSEDEFVALLCGVKPEAFSGSVLAANYGPEQAARTAIQRAVMAGALEAVWEEEPAKWEGRFVASKTIQYFTPANAIRWAENKRGEFPKFPQFLDSAEPSTELDGLGLTAIPDAGMQAEALHSKHGGGGTVTHRIEVRRDILDPAIDKAIQKAGGTDTAAVYLALRELALAEEQPFTGHFEEDALCYTNTQGKSDKITKEALRKRLKRRSENGR